MECVSTTTPETSDRLISRPKKCRKWTPQLIENKQLWHLWGFMVSFRVFFGFLTCFLGIYLQF
jgi:hypothetical protein